MKQYEAVIEAMRQSGGYATLGQLYMTATKIPGSNWEGTKTPFASIRRIVQVYPQLFFKIRPGLWALTSEREAVLRKLELDAAADSPRARQSDHSYYQGLLVEIGNLKKYDTFVPHQDKNRAFMSRRLAELTSLKQFPAFTHERLLSRAKTVDVSWFNERGLPYAFFEVEHSTPIRNSLQKFVQFQDFRIKFRVVADAARRRDFEKCLDDFNFTPVRRRVEFLDYEKLAAWHTRTAALVALEENIDL